MARKVKTKLGFPGKVEEAEITIPDSDPDPWGVDSKLAVVGTRVPRVDGPVKVTGKAKYTHDISLPGMLYARILRSPVAAGKLTRLDLSAAEKLEGVHEAVAAKHPGTPVLFHGDEIAAVAAESEEIAEEALRRIRFEIDPGKPVTTIEASRKPGAPKVYAARDNVQSPEGESRGNPADAIRGADFQVEAKYETQVQTHSSLETHGLVVSIEGDDATIWISTQATFGCQGQASRELKGKNVRVIAEHVGGGFGSKFAIGREGNLAIELAKRTKRPVQLLLDRQGEHVNGGNRPSSIQEFRGGVNKDGRIAGIEVVTYGSAGVGSGAGVTHPGVYQIPAWSKREHHVFTNAGASAAFRAPGHPQGSFGLESFLDELAVAAGMDPLEFRRRNCRGRIHPAEFDLGAEKFGWAGKWKKQAGSDPGPRKRGAGMASSIWYNAGGPGSQVDLVVRPDATVEVRNGAQDIGTGTRTVLAVCVAEELGIEPSRVHVLMGDTRLPVGPGSGGSQTAPSLGPAARLAAHEAKQELLRRVADDLQARVRDLDLAGGKVTKEGAPTAVTFEQVCRKLGQETLQTSGRRGPNYSKGFEKTVAGVQFAEVEVDTETGQVKVLQVVAVQDAGKVIDRLTFESQIAGGVVQGVSYALFEERRLDPNLGVMLNPDFLHYKIAGSRDCPEIHAIAFDVSNGLNSCGMMGLGEPPTIPTAAAIANAVANAIGVRVRSLPITPDKVLAALEAKK